MVYTIINETKRNEQQFIWLGSLMEYQLSMPYK